MKWENKDEIINMLEEQWYYLMNPDNVEEFIKCWTDAFKWYELYDYFFWDGDYEEKLSLFIKSILKSNKDTIIYADSENINWIVQWAPPWFTWGSSLQFMLAWAWKWLFKKWFYGALKRWTYVEKVSYNIKKALTKKNSIEYLKELQELLENHLLQKELQEDEEDNKQNVEEEESPFDNMIKLLQNKEGKIITKKKMSKIIFEE